MADFQLTIYTQNEKGETVSRTATIHDPLKYSLDTAFMTVRSVSSLVFAKILDDLMSSKGQ